MTAQKAADFHHRLETVEVRKEETGFARSLTRGWTRSIGMRGPSGSSGFGYVCADRYTAESPSTILRNCGLRWSYAVYPEAQYVSPPVSGTVSLCR